MRTKKEKSNVSDGLRPDYDLASLRGGVRGKYYARAVAGTNLVLIEPEIAAAFPDSRAVNDALRVLVKVAKTQVGKRSRRKRLSNKALQPRSRARRKTAKRRSSRAARG